MSATLTIIGGLTAPVEIRFTPAGKAVANFTVASTPRYLDKNTNEWKNGETLFQRCNIWGEPAEALAESNLDKGTRVIVTGRLKSRSFETREGEKRTVQELEVDEFGVSTKYATVKVTKVSKGGGGSRAAEDPWGSSPQGGSFTSSAPDDEPPF
ncbi:single-stranded DNA-binding protein [Nocardia flavorosea]|uniref:Single-stranded DNA-binding protein n=1 Tax=Nocardia flavorosea TaxID=53429 RepID=A0A846YTA3_9NOCA|nr:single-stranded DNA-binding protein [Nocardia flavorosea]NKY60780.1 single-stranded DNA-binding protein [Nocardia flavorosea]